MSIFTDIDDPAFHAFLEKLLAGRTYRLPGNPATDKYLIGCSGGADSSVLAILLHALFPHIDFQLAFTDTKADDPGIYESMERLEKFIGKSITKIVPEKGLYEKIEDFDGFLPSGQARWCTRELKLVPFQAWMRQFEGLHKILFAGVRADENERVAFTIEDCDTEMPFVDLGLKREDIFDFMSKTIGVPRFYEHRTRSGCSVCFFQRRSEVVGLYQYQPIEFKRGMKFEKLSVFDQEHHVPATPLWKDSGIALNWLNLPLPKKEGNMVGKRVNQTTRDIFGKKGIFVAAEFFFDGFLGHQEFIWKQRVISFSPTLHGIKQQVDDRFRHLLATSEVFDMTNDDVRNKVRFAIYYVEEPEESFFPTKSDETYSWKADNSYAQIEHVVSTITRSLHAAALQEQAESPVTPNTVQEEWKEAAVKGIAAIKEPIGQVSNAHWYLPKEEMPNMSDEEMITTVPCPMCSI